MFEIARFEAKDSLEAAQLSDGAVKSIAGMPGS